ncbi:hypothetical protein M231_04216 [Tremella mesenterica]|uniref:Zn(2)-C6 fungal-type domain-containing protein n=1 Tax=Tremella mesenterica TaxID=5217 RepID=A0A4Q1BKZ3_TREME|nr:hypothetical protein M231_04216 [Tremella mesenterica]
MAGDHKCPLCSATFTRPQHVGRHLRAHTGDRPYECKECPLRFARSDLLSRHVNKAHKSPDGVDQITTKKENKKGRRKSIATSVVSDSPVEPEPESSRRASFDQPGLQAQRMYPNHPLLANPPQPSQVLPFGAAGWTSGQMSIGPSGDLNHLMPDLSVGMGFQGGALGSHFSGLKPEQQGMTSVPMGRNGSLSSLSSVGYEFGFKKRACDQCNHSKVRCDFQEPCARCSHRNVMCTYHKPRSRTVTPILANRVSPINAAVNNIATPMSGSTNSSPLTQFPSPVQSAPRYSPPRSVRQNGSMAAPGQYSDSNQLQTTDPLSGAWSQEYYVSEPVPLPTSQWSTPPMHQAMVDQHFVGSHNLQSTSIYASPGHMNPPLPPAPQNRPMRSLPGSFASGKSSSSSPPDMDPTPSLTSLTTISPSSSDELSPPRNSGNVQTTPPGIWNVGKVPIRQSSTSDQSVLASPYTPAQIHSGLPGSLTVPNMPNDVSWYSTSTFDPSHQLSSSSTSEGEDARFDSAIASDFLNMDEETIQRAIAQHHRRRSSTGVWANAFNQMSLRDVVPQLASSDTSNSSTMFTNPFMASQLAQHVQKQHDPRRPTVSIAPVADGDNAKVPTLADLQDVWKQFISDPMNGFALGDKPRTDDDLGVSVITPRPGYGRTLSKSNSMPDLKSPGLTARPAANGVNGLPLPTPTTEEAMQKWKVELQNRQTSFNMQFDVKRRSGSISSSAQSNNSQSGGNLPPRLIPNPISNTTTQSAHSTIRPMASAVQRSSALQQTLAPQRLPSFGLQHTPSPYGGPNGHYFSPAENQKHTSMFARPGNKRLASQTLVSQEGKRASFSLWDGDDGVEGPSGLDATGWSGVPLYPVASAGLAQDIHSMGGNGQPTPVFFQTWPPKQ